MRHRATRPFTGLLLRLPRVTVRRLGLAAGPARHRVLGLLIAVLVLGGGGYAVVASVVGGSANPRAESPVTPEPPASGEPSPTGRPGKPSASTSPRPEAAAPTGPTGLTGPSNASPSAAEARGRLAPPATGSATPAQGRVAAADLGSPDTTVSHAVTGPGEVLLTFSADEAVTFACSLDGAASAPCQSTDSYSDLDPGWHTFAVHATDAAGNVDASPATTRWLSTNGDPSPEGSGDAGEEEPSRPRGQQGGDR